ncbi:hypothetical protein ACFL35_07045 [Candidatus Riflebacteria bacterium]
MEEQKIFRVRIPYFETANPGREFSITIEVEAETPEKAREAALDIFYRHEQNAFASWIREPILEKITLEIDSD